MRNQHVDATDLMPVGQPLHFRIGHLLSIATIDFTEGNIVGFVVGMRDRTGDLRHLVTIHLTLSRIELITDQIHTAHIAVLQQLHHVTPGHPAARNTLAMLHKVPHGVDIALLTPFRHTTVHGTTP